MMQAAHVVLYSADADADRAFFRDVLEFPFVDAGHDWLIYAHPPAEIAMHPADTAGHELFLMCDDWRRSSRRCRSVARTGSIGG